jgi:hypothetical protein
VRGWPALALLTLACGNLAGGDLDRTIAIDILGSLTPEVEEGDSLQLQARAVDARGDSVPDAVIVWAIVDTGDVGFTVDSATGWVVASHPGTGRVAARTRNVRSGDLQITVLPAPDSLAATSEVRLTVASGVSASSPAEVIVLDTTTEPGTQLALPEKVVHFLVVEPPSGSPELQGFFLATTDTVPGTDPFRVDAVTDQEGLARAVVRRVSGSTQPESTVVHAVALTALGDTTAGSPVQFVVLFEND